MSSQRGMKFTNQILCWILVLQTGFGPAFVAAAEQARGPRAQGTTQGELNRLMGEIQLDPALQMFEQDTTLPTQLDLSPSDPLVDQDPFFLRAQAWEKSASPSDDGEALYELGAEGVKIRLPGQNQVWRLNAPIHPILKTDEYIYFAANAGSGLFEGKDNGQGVFLVPYRKLLSASASGLRVPVLFFPLPGSSWTAKSDQDIGATEIPHRGIVVLTDTSGASLPLNLADVRSVARAGSMNLLFALSQGMDALIERLKASSGASEELRAALARTLSRLAQEAGSASPSAQPSKALLGDLAGSFELLSAAMEKASGSSEIAVPRGSTAGFGLFYTGFDLSHPEKGSVIFRTASSSSYSFLKKIIDAVGIPSASAMDPATQRYLERSTRVLAICTLVFVAGVVLKYTWLKGEVGKRAERKSDPGYDKKVKWDLFAHSMTVLSQFPTVWSSQLLRFTLDKAHIGENSIVRKLFNSTFGFALKTSDKTPVDSKTLLYGVGGVGGVEMVLIPIQGYLLLPAMAHGIAWVFPAMAPRVAAAYSSENAAVATYLMTSVLQNFVTYTTSGAYHFAHDVQTINMNEGERIIRELMRNEGKVADLPEHRVEFTSRVRAYVRESLVSQGLPQEEDFWYDANTLYSRSIAFFGYGDGKRNQGSAGELVGLSRPGLTQWAVNRAVKKARLELEADTSSVESAQAYDILRRVQARMSVVRRFIQSPASFLSVEALSQVAREFRQVRLELMPLTFEGPTGAPISAVPESWSAQHSEGAQAAARLFRGEFFGILREGKPANPFWTGTANVLSKPFRAAGDAFEIWQIQRALTRANELFVSETHADPDSVMAEEGSENPSENRKLWERLFREELLKVAGLAPDYQETELLEIVEANAAQKWEELVAGGGEWIQSISVLPAEARSKAITIKKADIFSEAYVQATIKQGIVGPFAPAQPGRFQKFRQSGWVKRSAPMTKLVRAAEGLFSNSRFGRGLWPYLARNLPLLDDVAQGNLMQLKRFPVAATALYLWSSTIWNVALNRSDWLFSYVVGATVIAAPWITTLRLTGNLGIRPNNSFVSMAKYAAIGSFATMFGMLIFPMFNGDYHQLLDAAGAACTRYLEPVKALLQK